MSPPPFSHAGYGPEYYCTTGVNKIMSRLIFFPTRAMHKLIFFPVSKNQIFPCFQRKVYIFPIFFQYTGITPYFICIFMALNSYLTFILNIFLFSLLYPLIFFPKPSSGLILPPPPVGGRICNFIYPC